MRADLDEFISQQHLSLKQAETIVSRLEYASSVDEAARQADLIIEAVPDELESKLEIFTLLDKICRPATILATTTQMLSVTEIASITFRPDRCIGMRFAWDNRIIRLELVCGTESSRETRTVCERAARRLAKEVAIVDDHRLVPPA
jgi:3-hydroxybutyryl-CoA dehydrogenase